MGTMGSVAVTDADAGSYQAAGQGFSYFIYGAFSPNAAGTITDGIGFIRMSMIHTYVDVAIPLDWNTGIVQLQASCLLLVFSGFWNTGGFGSSLPAIQLGHLKGPIFFIDENITYINRKTSPQNQLAVAIHNRIEITIGGFSGVYLWF